MPPRCSPAPRSPTPRERGFTLLEVTLAIVILAAALTILLGLQAGVISRTLGDTKRQRAMMYARQILANVEMSEDEIDVEDRSGSVSDILALTGTIDPRDTAAQEFEDAADMVAHFTVEPWGISPELPDTMKKISLRLSWGESPGDQLEIVYFVPFELAIDEEESLEEE